tara:strand:+ start:2831 stop:3049 length:219 start_codon:yes stop_codon:yes gene_type:complete
MIEIDRNFECKKCNSNDVSYHIFVRQEFSITFPDSNRGVGFCNSCNDRTYIVETESSKQEFEESLIINLGVK